jgi:O-antigen ligase/tetratricopeptide (TPR) repeat protein
VRTTADRTLPLLLLLPALLFATPLSPLVDDPYPHLAGMGWSVWALVPAALMVAVCGAPLRPALPFLLTGLWALLPWLGGVRGSDPLEAARVACVLAMLPLALSAGAALDAPGRRTLASGLMLVSTLLMLHALASALLGGPGLAGLLGDTGSVSQAALPGAAVAAGRLADRRGGARVVAALVLALFLVHVASAPVLAGSHTLLAALLLGAWRRSGSSRKVLAGLAAVALMAPFLGMAGRELAGRAPTVMEGAPTSPSHSLRGLGVRGEVWWASLGMVLDEPLHGVGPGQFQAAFPPYRDPREIELSRHGVCAEGDTEVEHPHNDWLWPWLELGVVGGLLFLGGLVLAARRSLDALSAGRDPDLALASLALLVNALVHAPLSANPGSVVMALAVWGSTASGTRRSGPGRLLALPVLAVALLLAPRLVGQGRALRAYVAAARELDGSADPARAAQEARAAIEAALETAPDDVPALLLAAQLAPLETAGWEAVLARRPHAVEALEGLATARAVRGEVALARERYQQALALSPTHPRLLRNLVRLEGTAGEAQRARETLDRLRAQGCLDEPWLAELARELILVHGRAALGAEWLGLGSLATLQPEALHADAREEGREGGEADSLECLAQLLWARQNAAAGAFDVAVRNYRQARDRSRAHTAEGAAPYRLELEAARRRAGLPAEPVPALDERTRRELPGWAREALDPDGES